ncbi:MAG TPA: twin-arginine translocation signal domain-containing protein, partial [Actinomycetota bacterium]
MRHPREGWKSRMSRRDFLRRSAGAAVALPSLSAVLAACERPGAIKGEGGFQAARPDNPVTLPLNGEPIPDGLQPEKDAVLQIFNWDQYVWKRVVQEFVDEFGLAGFEITT